MEYSIDIDTGGTFTDGFVRGGNKIVLAKVDTTPHDRTVCFMQCIEEAAEKLGLASAAELLAQTGTPKAFPLGRRRQVASIASRKTQLSREFWSQFEPAEEF